MSESGDDVPAGPPAGPAEGPAGSGLAGGGDRDEGGAPGGEQGFVPSVLDSTVIALPLLGWFEDPRRSDPHPVVIELNLEHPGGHEQARQRARQLIDEAIGTAGGTDDQRVRSSRRGGESHYLFASLDAAVVQEMVRRDREQSTSQATRAIFHVWPDFPVEPLITSSLSTVKADAAQVAFSASGRDVVWAVIDSGVDERHPHFAKHGNLEIDGIEHRDFTGSPGGPLTDEFGHGTHVAGIIAGEAVAGEPATRDKKIETILRYRSERGDLMSERTTVDRIVGVAPRCKILSLKVLDVHGQGLTSNIMDALAYVQEINANGRRIRVHGVNLSVGYQFEPEWFACGQSPLCVEVNGLVRAGVSAVVAAGNTGYGWKKATGGVVAAGMNLTINDPGNAQYAVTVGSTHRNMPHVYGVSYFSSKGPTGDGRAKPDLIAPGERILSCAAGEKLAANGGERGDCLYVEDSGTSMAAPHVSGAIAAFLSIRREFIGRPDDVKEIFCSTATDLKRTTDFQGRGLVDLMRAIQSV